MPDSTWVCFIPAKGSSSGVTNKNLRPLAGKPLIDWTFDCLAQSAAPTMKTYVLTDSPEIAERARQHSCYTFTLSDTLVQPNIPSFKAIKAAYEHLLRNGLDPDHVLVLRPTTPFRTGEDITDAIEYYRSAREEGRADCLTSVTKKIAAHPARLKKVTEDGLLRDHLPAEHLGDLKEEYYPLPRQWYDDVYVRNGAIYIVHSSLLQESRLWNDRQLAFVMPEERSLNINTEFQFRVADLLQRAIQQESTATMD